jgi:hypothetical protein
MRPKVEHEAKRIATTNKSLGVKFDNFILVEQLDFDPGHLTSLQFILCYETVF